MGRMATMPDELADRQSNMDGKDPIAWMFVGQRLITGRAYRHVYLLEQHFSHVPEAGLPNEGLAGYIVNDRIVSWQEPTVEELDTLWKQFGCLAVDYLESMKERLACTLTSGG